MKNNFLNNNGVNLHNTKKNPKTKVESQIDLLKQQEQVIIAELDWWESKNKNLDELLANLAEVEKFSTEFLTEVVNQEKERENLDIDLLEQSIKNKTEFNLQFSAGREAFYQLVWQKIEFKVSYLRSKLNDIQKQLDYQERIFARIEARRQGKNFLPCEYKKNVGCLGAWQCANCQVNYSVNSQPFSEETTL